MFLMSVLQVVRSLNISKSKLSKLTPSKGQEMTSTPIPTIRDGEIILTSLGQILKILEHLNLNKGNTKLLCKLQSINQRSLYWKIYWLSSCSPLFNKISKAKTYNKVCNKQHYTKAVRKLEVQMGQLASAWSEREKGKFPSQPEINPKNQELIKGITTLRSGRATNNKVGIQESVEKEKEEPKALEDKSNEEDEPRPYLIQKLRMWSMFLYFHSHTVQGYPRKGNKLVILWRCSRKCKSTYLSLMLSSKSLHMPSFSKTSAPTREGLKIMKR